MKNHNKMLNVVIAMRDYIDAIPDSAAATFPAMPGFDRDWADDIIESAEQENKKSKKIIWIAFNSNGSICSTTNEEPSSACDQWDNPWFKMISE